jgi:hypothetical protein
VRGIIGDGHLFFEEDGREDDSAGFDSEIVCWVCHG